MLSKWDIGGLDLEDVRLRLLDKLRQRPPVIATSALTGRGLERLLASVDDLYDRYTGRVSTGTLNRILAEAAERRQPPGRARPPAQGAVRRPGADPPAALPAHGQRPRRS